MSFKHNHMYTVMWFWYLMLVKRLLQSGWKSVGMAKSSKQSNNQRADNSVYLFACFLYHSRIFNHMEMSLLKDCNFLSRHDTYDHRAVSYLLWLYGHLRRPVTLTYIPFAKRLALKLSLLAIEKWKVHIVKLFVKDSLCSMILFKKFVFFIILEVKDLRFWPLKYPTT